MSLPSAVSASNLLMPAAGLVSGCLLALCFPPLGVWPLAWVALVPLGALLAADRLSRASWSGLYLGALVYHLAALGWLRTSYAEGSHGGPYLCGWLIAGHVGAFTLVVAVWAGRRFYLRTRLPIVWTLPLVWVAFQQFRRLAMAAVDGVGTPWFDLAFTQVDALPVVQVADLGGTWAVNLLVALGNGIVYEWIRLVSRRRFAFPPYLVAAVALIAIAVSYGQWRLHEPLDCPGPNCVLMGSQDLPPLLQKQRLSEQAAGTTAELLIWPELAYHHSVVDCELPPHRTLPLPDDLQRLTKLDANAYADQVCGYLSDAARQTQAALIIGCQRLEGAPDGWRRFNSLAVVDPEAGYLGCYNKRYLVPWVEFVPLDLTRLGVPGQRVYESGCDQPVFRLQRHDARPIRIACAVCYDIAFPMDLGSRTEQAPIDLIVQCGSECSDTTGGQSDTLLRMAQLRAIECRTSIVRNANGGHSAVIDGSGRVLWKSNRQVIDQPVAVPCPPLDSRRSYYAICGDWPALVTMVLVGVVGCCPVTFRRRWASPGG